MERNRKAIVGEDGRTLTVMYAHCWVTIPLPFDVWEWAAIQRIEDEMKAQGGEGVSARAWTMAQKARKMTPKAFATVPGTKPRVG